MKKAMRKGFSMVELIIALVIAAIILALCAPNVSAYVQSAKLQNYRTTLNNLVGDVQSQLPQTRYWNWEEVKENAESILRSDTARTVTYDTTNSTTDTAVYSVAGASTDANVVYTISLNYDTSATSSNTTQQVTVEGSCDGYSSVTSSETCEVLLKTSYSELESTTTIAYDESGWKSMDNMAGTYSYWSSYNSANPEHDFGIVFYSDENAFYLNLTDYPSGACEQVIFNMQRYQVTENSKTEIGYYDEDGNWIQLGDSYADGDTYIEYYYYDDGVKTKASYVYSQLGYTNSSGDWKAAEDGDEVTIDEYYYVDTNELAEGYFFTEIGYTDADENWVKVYNYNVGDEYTITNYYYVDSDELASEYVYGQLGYIDNDGDWNAVYDNSYAEGDTYTVSEYYYYDVSGEKVVIYWQSEWGSTIQINGVEYDVYNETVEYTLEKKYFCNSGKEVRAETRTYTLVEKYFCSSDGVSREVLYVQQRYTLETKYFYNGIEVSEDAYTVTTRYYDTYVPVFPTLQTQNATGTGGQYAVSVDDFSCVQIYVGKDADGNELWEAYTDIFYTSGDYAYMPNTSTTAGQLYVDYYGDDIINGSKNDSSYTWAQDEGKTNIYIKYRVNPLPSSTRGWLYITGKVYGSQTDYINPVIDNDLQVYINYHRDDADYSTQPVILQTGYGVNPGLEDGNGASDQRIWIDISNCGYCVGNILKITLTNVNADKILEKVYDSSVFNIRCTTPDGQTDGCSTLETTSAGYTWYSNHNANPSDYPTYDLDIFNSSLFSFDDVVTLEKGDTENSLVIRMDATWSIYPYLRIFSSYCLPGFTVDADLTLEWEDEVTTKTISIPQITINGDDDYAYVTLDWSGCTDTVKSNYSLLGLTFMKNSTPYTDYSLTIYDVNYNEVTTLSSGGSSTFMLSQLSYNSMWTSILNNGILSFYFEGISANELQVTFYDDASGSYYTALLEKLLGTSTT